jgi:RimJ/RimL family protein N-acetyltransferase
VPGANVILGEGVSLRPPVAGDAPRWLELLHDADQLRFATPSVVPVPATVAELEPRIQAAAERYAAREPGTLVVADAAAPDHLLGLVTWRWDVPPVLQVSDIGYSVHPDARGLGVARRAVSTFARWLTLDPEGPHQARVQLDHSVENTASCRVALAAGFAREGIRRGFLPLRDAASSGGFRRHDVCLHGLLPER